MKEISLADYVEQHGQTETAKHLNITQGAVWQALERGRNVKVIVHEDGCIEGVEIKAFGRRERLVDGASNHKATG